MNLNPKELFNKSCDAQYQVICDWISQDVAKGKFETTFNFEIMPINKLKLASTGLIVTEKTLYGNAKATTVTWKLPQFIQVQKDGLNHESFSVN